MGKIAAILTIFSLLWLGGCKSNPISKPEFNTIDTGTQTQPASGFNQEHYIWESWLFPASK